ncbi:MAG TPA: hypothetical protein DHM44_05045 [Flexistipes sinusarabici]|jgi:hypothetical protein|uniref:Tetratricopeptide repeat protein n=1 Tax=Flexistipes sinusarabici TaxID=2352 RepID=A0A3D5QBD6_FLESI|nr:hypothetical protein [Flexistipes sinusarabici]
MNSWLIHKRTFYLMLKLVLFFFILTAGFTGLAIAYDVTNLRPVYNYEKDVLSPGMPPKALLFVSYNLRRDIAIIKEFAGVCDDYDNVSCLCVDKSRTALHLLKASAENLSDSCYVYQDKLGSNTIKPYVLFLNSDNSLYKKMFYSSGFEPKLKSYLGFLNGNYDEKTLTEKLVAIDKSDDVEKIVPRLNFVVLLAKKGMREAALREMNDITVDNSTPENEVLLVAQVYLRLDEPTEALKVLDYCEGDECNFYKGVSYYMLEDLERAEKIFKNIDTDGELEERADAYLNKIQDRKGATENEDN